jgi:hypothetical protein
VWIFSEIVSDRVPQWPYDNTVDILPTHVFTCFIWFSIKTAIIFLKSINQLAILMENVGVYSEVGNEFRNTCVNFRDRTEARIKPTKLYGK